MGGGGEGCSFYRKNKLKSMTKYKYSITKYSMAKKVYKQLLFSVTTKNLNLEVLIQYLVIFKGWDGVKDEKL